VKYTGLDSLEIMRKLARGNLV